MSLSTLPSLEVANAHFVTERLLVGGDLDIYDDRRAVAQLEELLTVGVTHVIDCRFEMDDSEIFGMVPEISYLHHGMDDAGQRVPAAWFERGAGAALDAFADPDARVLTHCHMGINRGPSLGYAVLLALGWDPVEAIAAIRRARPIANVWYAEDAVRWHHGRIGAVAEQRRVDCARLAAWRSDNELDVVRIIAAVRRGERR